MWCSSLFYYREHTPRTRFALRQPNEYAKHNSINSSEDKCPVFVPCPCVCVCVAQSFAYLCVCVRARTLSLFIARQASRMNGKLSRRGIFHRLASSTQPPHLRYANNSWCTQKKKRRTKNTATHTHTLLHVIVCVR